MKCMIKKILTINGKGQIQSTSAIFGILVGLTIEGEPIIFQQFEYHLQSIFTIKEDVMPFCNRNFSTEVSAS